MPKEDATRRRHVLLVDVTQAASEVSRLVHEARDLTLPIERAFAMVGTRSCAGRSYSTKSSLNRPACPGTLIAKRPLTFGSGGASVVPGVY
jgi:hypothetical protein